MHWTQEEGGEGGIIPPVPGGEGRRVGALCTEQEGVYVHTLTICCSGAVVAVSLSMADAAGVPCIVHTGLAQAAAAWYAKRGREMGEIQIDVDRREIDR